MFLSLCLRQISCWPPTRCLDTYQLPLVHFGLLVGGNVSGPLSTFTLILARRGKKRSEQTTSPRYCVVPRVSTDDVINLLRMSKTPLPLLLHLCVNVSATLPYSLHLPSISTCSKYLFIQVSLQMRLLSVHECSKLKPINSILFFPQSFGFFSISLTTSFLARQEERYLFFFFNLTGTDFIPESFYSLFSIGRYGFLLKHQLLCF